MSLFLALVGIQVLHYAALALRMSLFRVAEMNKKKSSPECEQFYDFQMLTAEWLPAGVACCLGLHLKFPGVSSLEAALGSPNLMVTAAALCAVVFVATRVIFSLRAVWPGMPFGLRFVVMTTCYVVTFGMGALLVIA